MIRRFQANYLFDGYKLLKNAVVEIDSQTSTIVCVRQPDRELPNCEFYNGVIVPGFVNAHCHLELSHLKGVFPACNHLIDFLLCVNNSRGSIPYSYNAAYDADKEMYKQGIQAVGDICNTADSIEVKKNSLIKYVNFIELIGTSQSRAKKNVETYQNVAKAFVDAGFNCPPAVAHAPYSVGPIMFDTINKLNVNNTAVFSIHNQETADENEIYRSGVCEFKTRFSQTGIDMSPIPTTGYSSLVSCGGYFKNYNRVILVHNTFCQAEDMDFALSAFNNPFFCLCPKSNLMLEHTLPNINAMLNKNLTICIGTDSLSSNNSLSIVEELYAIHKAYPNIGFEKLASWATINGARALGLDDKFGSFDCGKQAGAILLENFDFSKMNVAKDTCAKRLV